MVITASTALQLGMCGMGFSSSVRFREKPRVWFGFLCRLVVRCRLIIWFHDHLGYCPTVSVTWRMLKLCENGSNIDYLYKTSSVLKKARETEILGLTFWLRFGSVWVFKNRNRTKIRIPHIPIGHASVCRAHCQKASDPLNTLVIKCDKMQKLQHFIRKKNSMQEFLLPFWWTTLAFFNMKSSMTLIGDVLTTSRKFVKYCGCCIWPGCTIFAPKLLMAA